MSKKQRQAAQKHKQTMHRAMGSKFMHVYPNPYGVAPYCTLDKMGLPAGTPPTDPSEDGTGRRWVGVRIDRVRTHFTEGKPMKGDDLRSRPQVTVFSYLGISALELTPGALVKRDPVTVPRSRFYVQQVNSGSLIPADEATAKFCIVGFKKFEKPVDVLKRNERAAVADFDARYGEGAFRAQRDELDAKEQQRRDAEKPREEVSKPKKTPAAPSA